MPLTFPFPPGRVWQSASPVVVQRRLRAVEDRAREQRIYAPHHIPDLLQTSDYATAVLTAETWAARRPVGEVAAAVAERFVRQDRWRRAAAPRRVEVVLGEQALYTRPDGPPVMDIQLKHLLALVEDPPDRASIAIVPRHAARPGGDFTILNDPERVIASTLTGALTLTRPRHVSAYTLMFARLVEQAVGGADAADLITAAITFHARSRRRASRGDRRVSRDGTESVLAAGEGSERE
ncbi:DUF5753 domain-containing protein [Nocardia takedensis]